MNRGKDISHRLEQPDEIYVSLVRSLYSDPRTLAVGSIGTISACLVTAYKTGDPVFAAWVALFTLVYLLRAWDVRSFARRTGPELTVTDAKIWELRYTFGSSVYVLLMGLWCFLAFARSADPVVQLLCFTMTIVNMIGVAARNFGSKDLVSAQLICAGTPLFLGLFWMGDIYYAISACVIIPFFVSFKTIAGKLRDTLSGAVMAANRARMLADRLDTALNNMAHGLCMIDPDGSISIANERLPEVFGVDQSVFRTGRSARKTLMDCVRLGAISRDEARQLMVALRSRGHVRQPSLVVSLRDGRLLMLTFRGMPDGGSVMLAEDVTEQRNAAERISHLAHHDPLTDLPNRVQFRERVRDLLIADGPNASCAILFIDLDEFKQVNDTLGHPCGDELLKQVALRLRRLLGDEHLIARLGGDEFVLVIRRLSSPVQPAEIARQVIEELSRPYTIEGHTIIIGASIGIALAPTDGRDPDALLKNADMALYRAKSEGRGRWRFFEPEMDLQVKQRRALELDLRKALQTDGLELHFQPMIDLKTGRIAACEALLRWPHPERGYISPAEFVPLAEEMGLIVEIGSWVLKRACKEAASWPGDIRVAVNLSPIQFRQKGLLENIEAALEEAGLPASRLEIEITESAFLNDSSAVLSILHKLKAVGTMIALDDFGTGYSSLSYLRKFPLDIVKIDRSFLQGLDQNEGQVVLLKGISRLCRDLGLSVTIEGVETYAQLDVIQSMKDIEVAQGFLFSKPVPASLLRHLLSVLTPTWKTRSPQLVRPKVAASGH